jgi:uncharacterized protein YbaR (Trm112 family)
MAHSEESGEGLFAAFDAGQLRWLRCPGCRGSLDMTQDVALMGIRCSQCGRRFPIVDGLPMLLA